MQKILTILGVVWSIIAFIAIAAFFVGGEWAEWKKVKAHISHSAVDGEPQKLDASLSFGEKQIKELGQSYVAKTNGFVIATVESLGQNNNGAICGVINRDGSNLGSDPTKIGASVYRKGSKADSDDLVYMPVSSLTMVVSKEDNWLVEVCGGKPDATFRSRVNWIPVTITTDK